MFHSWYLIVCVQVVNKCYLASVDLLTSELRCPLLVMRKIFPPKCELFKTLLLSYKLGGTDGSRMAMCNVAFQWEGRIKIVSVID